MTERNDPLLVSLPINHNVSLIQIYGVDTFMDKLKNRGTLPSPKYKKLVDDTRILLGLK